MKTLLLIGVAGAIGALSRYAVVSAVGMKYYPYGTLLVNVLGSFLMGLAFIFIVEKAHLDPHFKPLIMIGALGAFTTFSAFSLESWEMIERGDLLSALAYILASVVLCILALGAGIFIARLTFL
jgi:CrcB protein